MKLFNKKEEKLKVGRPRIADTETKKKAIISVCIALVLVITLALTGAFKLNIINLNKVKGQAIITCPFIPDKYKPYDEATNPLGLHDYGFTDLSFYNAVISSYGISPYIGNEFMSISDSKNNENITSIDMCVDITEEQLNSMIAIIADGFGVQNLDGIEYLNSLAYIEMPNNELANQEIFKLPKKLFGLKLQNNNLTGDLDLSKFEIKNHAAGNYIDLSNNNLSSVTISNVGTESINVSDTGIKNLILNNVNIGIDTDYIDDSLESITINNSDINLYLENSNIRNINTNNSTFNIFLINCKNLTSLDLSSSVVSGMILNKNPLLSRIKMGRTPDEVDDMNGVYMITNNPKLESIEGLEKLEKMGGFLSDNISNIDLRNTTELIGLGLSDPKLTSNIYMLKDEKIEYNKNIKLNEKYEITYAIEDNGIAKYENGMLNAIRTGKTNITMSNENIMGMVPEMYENMLFCGEEGYLSCDETDSEEFRSKLFTPYLLKKEIKIYDVTSDVYDVDKKNKTIDVLGKDFDTSKINLHLEDLKGYIEENNYVIKDGENIVDVYNILNSKVEKPEKEETPSITTTKENDVSKNTTTIEPITTTKKNRKSSSVNTTTKTEIKPDIKLISSNIPALLLKEIKGTNRNIIVQNDNVTFTINGKDIDSIDGNIDLSYELKPLKESTIYEEVKDKLKNGMVLRFKDNFSLPYKILVELNVNDNIAKNMKIKDINIYNYDNKLTLVAQKMNIKDNKFKFYVEKLGTYVLSDSEIKDSKINKTLVKENTKLDKKINTGIIVIGIFILLLLILIIIGYINYKKNKDKNS